MDIPFNAASSVYHEPLMLRLLASRACVHCSATEEKVSKIVILSFKLNHLAWIDLRYCNVVLTAIPAPYVSTPLSRI